MSIDDSTLLFFDASCLIAAAASPNGGAGLLWSLCEQGVLIAAVSRPVLTETEVNLLKKFPRSALERHRLQIGQRKPRIAEIPRLDVVPRRYPAINPKDEHVIVAALAVKAVYVLSLDRPLIAEINAANLGVHAVSPGAFLQTLLPTHTSFQR